MKTVKSLLAILVFSGYSNCLLAQSLAINTDGSTAHSSAMVDVKSTIKGMLLPRMSKSQRNAIATPANGLMVYVNAPDTTGLSFYDGSAWKWVEEKGGGWGLIGNAGTDPSTNFIGTTDSAALAFRIWNFEMMRLTRSSHLGILESNPRYMVDISAFNSYVDPCPNFGLRIKNWGTPSDCDKGLVIGFLGTNTQESMNQAKIWNYGQNSSFPKNIIFGFGAGSGSYETMRINEDNHVGINEQSPKYNLDIMAASTTTCGTKVGLRISNINSPGTLCDRGFFVGYNDMANPKEVSLWNLTPSVSSTDQSFRFGFGTDLGPFGLGEAMRILPPGQGIGIGVRNPLAMLHIINQTGSGLPSGMLVTNPNNPATNGFFVGLGGPLLTTGNEAKIWSKANADVTFGTDDKARMTIKGNGNLFFGGEYSATPTGKAIFFVDTIEMNKDLRVFGNARADSIFTEDIRITNGAGTGKFLSSDAFGNGSWVDLPTPNNYWTANGNHIYNNNIDYVGIGNSNPVSPLSFPSATGDKISLWGLTALNSFGFGVQNNLLQMYSATSADDIAFGIGGSFSFTERMRIKGNGNVGIGTSNPNALLQFPNNTLNRKIVLWESANNDNQFYGLGINGGVFRYQVGDVGDNHVFYAGAGSAASNELMRIKGNGNVGIGTNNPTERLHVIGNILASGTITPSDLRYKKSIQPITNSLEKLQQLNGVTYQFNQTAFPEWQFDDKIQFGLIAQEVEKVFPEMVKTIDEKGYKGVDYVKLIPVLLEAIKELKKENNLQQQQIDQLLKAGGNQQ